MRGLKNRYSNHLMVEGSFRVKVNQFDGASPASNQRELVAKTTICFSSQFLPAFGYRIDRMQPRGTKN